MGVGLGTLDFYTTECTIFFETSIVTILRTPL